MMKGKGGPSGGAGGDRGFRGARGSAVEGPAEPSDVGRMGRLDGECRGAERQWARARDSSGAEDDVGSTERTGWA